MKWMIDSREYIIPSLIYEIKFILRLKHRMKEQKERLNATKKLLHLYSWKGMIKI